MASVVKKFPNIRVNATNEMGETIKITVLEEAVKNKKKVLLLWYTKDVTFVCTTELHAYHEALIEFEKRNVMVIGASCDHAEVHFAWVNKAKDDGGSEGVTYPLIADSKRNLSSHLGILDIVNEKYDEETGIFTVEGDSVTYRATYLIDEEGTVFHESINHMPLGRNVQEYLRLVDAYAHVQEKGEVCPANWEEGKEAMTADRDGVAAYLSQN